MFIGTCGLLLKGGLVLHQFVWAETETQKLAHNVLMMNFTNFFQIAFFLRCWFTTVAKYSRHTWSFVVFGANIS